MLILYDFPSSLNCRKVRMMLAERELEWDRVELDITVGEQYAPDYMELNPNGSVPTLVDGATVLTDSADILEYIERRYPAPPEEGEVDERVMRELLAVIASWDERSFMYGARRGFKRYLRPMVNRHRLRVLQQLMTEHPHLRDLYAAKIDQIRSWMARSKDKKRVARSRASLLSLLDRAEDRLFHSEFLAGSRISAADCAFMPLLQTALRLGFGSRIRRRPAVWDYWIRMRRRSSVRDQVIEPASVRSTARLMWRTLGNLMG